MNNFKKPSQNPESVWVHLVPFCTLSELEGPILIVLSTRSCALTYDREMWKMLLGHSKQPYSIGHLMNVLLVVITNTSMPLLSHTSHQSLINHVLRLAFCRTVNQSDCTGQSQRVFSGTWQKALQPNICLAVCGGLCGTTKAWMCL